MNNEERLRQALIYALSIIESYDLDIRQSKQIVGIELYGTGFCQGKIYLEAPVRIREVLEETKP